MAEQYARECLFSLLRNTPLIPGKNTLYRILHTQIGLVYVLPLDQHLYFHKLAGGLIFAQGWIHGVSHFVNFGMNVVATPAKFLAANAHYKAVKEFLDWGLYQVPQGCRIKVNNGTIVGQVSTSTFTQQQQLKQRKYYGQQQLQQQ